MSRMWMRVVVLLVAALLVVRCKSQATPTQAPEATSARPATPTSAPPTRVPTATVAEQSVATASPVTPTATQAKAAVAASPTTAPVAVTTGLTEDGHYFWGAPDAPVTMIDFSDFM